MHLRSFFITLLVDISATFVLATSAQAALMSPDINGNAVAGNATSSVFLYDSDRNITWLCDTNAGAGSIYDDGDNATNGRMTWVDTVNWAGALPVGIFASPEH